MSSLSSLAILGCGNMAQAILQGVLRAGLLPAERVTITNIDTAARDEVVARLGVRAAASNAEAVRGAAAVLLAVKPQHYAALAEEIRPHLAPGALLISIAAGMTMARLEAMYGTDAKLLHTMPNTPALIGQGVTAISPNAQVSADELAQVRALFAACGEVVDLAEKDFSAFAAVAACSPAFVDVFIEALADAGVAAGLARADAQRIAAQAVTGSGRLVLESGENPAVLKDRVCSPGGTTIAGVNALDEHGFRHAVKRAVAAAIARDREMQG